MLPEVPETGRVLLPCVAAIDSTSEPSSFSWPPLPTVAFPPALASSAWVLPAAAFPPALASPAWALVPAAALPLLRLDTIESRGGVGGKRLSTKACRASTLWVKDAMFPLSCALVASACSTLWVRDAMLPESCANMSTFGGKIDE